MATCHDMQPPARYMDYQEAFAYWQAASADLKREQAEDVAFARANNAIVTEGPWGDLPAQQVAYLGIDEGGQRILLSQISSAWRFNPVIGTYRPADSSSDPNIAVRYPDAPIAVRICLGRPMPGMVVGRPSGQVPVQSYGLIDGEEFYFRFRGGYWSLSVGPADAVLDPVWYHEEPYGDDPLAGRLTDDEAYDLLAKGAGLYRLGIPTMVRQ